MANLKRDRFELLSAYLDGEVTAAERRQVDDWLAHDPTVQCLYERLIKLRQGMRAIPVPPREVDVEQTVQQVMTRVHHRPRLVLTWGGAAIAAVFLGILSNHMPMEPSDFGQQVAVTPNVVQPTAGTDGEALMIALDHPIVEIPVAANNASSLKAIPAVNKQIP
ncbi:MAG TPA: zf-HC2 domain-containing protein [Chroococcidiopsis sp.]